MSPLRTIRGLWSGALAELMVAAVTDVLAAVPALEPRPTESTPPAPAPAAKSLLGRMMVDVGCGSCRGFAAILTKGAGSVETVLPPLFRLLLTI